MSDKDTLGNDVALFIPLLRVYVVLKFLNLLYIACIHVIYRITALVNPFIFVDGERLSGL